MGKSINYLIALCFILNVLGCTYADRAACLDAFWAESMIQYDANKGWKELGWPGLLKNYDGNDPYILEFKEAWEEASKKGHAFGDIIAFCEKKKIDKIKHKKK
ncbi:uncharacterized protein LOC100302428 precursor [Acyrthosiphon pisum]|uniref:Uncharacterized protein n=1 Tax=Acyrthosiphon pisum TaxID=7029 RepID=C4WXC7_ACYPI|nr:uncharacterized protein LOC100302428 precursor [Acyrthosiphon pisum]BAH72547.1 hypothetical protein [Acyrthosiphon pisum]|eukprot:NP_001156568.1 uncharacterized protein LOC100302428 precursor [Acyrthosiphon pisum]